MKQSRSRNTRRLANIAELLAAHEEAILAQELARREQAKAHKRQAAATRAQAKANKKQAAANKRQVAANRAQKRASREQTRAILNQRLADEAQQDAQRALQRVAKLATPWGLLDDNERKKAFDAARPDLAPRKIQRLPGAPRPWPPRSMTANACRVARTGARDRRNSRIWDADKKHLVAVQS